MSSDAARQFSEAVLLFLQQPRMARVSTVDSDGAPHVVPMWYRIDDGVFQFTTLLRRGTLRNLQRDPRVAFVVDDDDVRAYRGVMVAGRAELAPPTAWEPLTRAIARRYLGDRDGDRYTRHMLVQDGRVVVLVTPTAVTHWGFDRTDSVARVLSVKT